MTFLIPIAGTPPVTRTYTGINGSVSVSAVDRWAVACFGFIRGGATLPTLTGATIAGVTATILVQSGTATAGGFSCTAIAAAFIPAGVSGSVTPTYSLTPSNEAYALYDVHDWTGSLFGSATSTAKPSSLPVSVADSSVAIAVVCAADAVSGDPTASATWTAITEDSDFFYAAGNAAYLTTASDEFASAASITPTCTHTHTGNLQNACAVVLA